MLDSAINRASIDRNVKRRPALGLSRGLQCVTGGIRRAFRSSIGLRMSRLHPATAESPGQSSGTRLPAYLEDNYWWAYLRPASLKLLDHTPVVSAILWGRYARLKHAALAEIEPDHRILQAACVYGDFSSDIARSLGPAGRLEVIDIAPLQVTNCRRKLQDFRYAQVRVADAAAPGGGPYDVVCCFFLLHELPDTYKRKVVDALLSSTSATGRVVFIDYHRPGRYHPLKLITGFVFDCLEPFAKSLWHNEISSFARSAAEFTWRKETYFGGLYQKVVAERRELSDEVSGTV